MMYAPDQIDHLLNDQSAMLTAPAYILLDEAGTALVKQFAFDAFSEPPLRIETAAKVLSTFIDIVNKQAHWTRPGLDIVKDNHERSKINGRRTKLISLMNNMVIERPFHALSEREMEIFNHRANHQIAGHIKEDWGRFYARMTLGDVDQSLLTPATQYQGAEYLGRAREALEKILRDQVMSHQAFLAHQALLISTADDLAQGPQSMSRFQRNRLLQPTDVPASIYTLRSASPTALPIGYFREHNDWLAFDGAESITFNGGPGTGKSQTIAMPILLSYPGSMVVLDPKGELYDACAGFRAENYGPVYRFAPTDPEGTDKYNVLEHLSDEPHLIGTQMDSIAQMLIPPSQSDDPIWENRARSFTYAFGILSRLRPQSDEPPSIGDIMNLFGRVADEDARFEIAENLTRLSYDTDLEALEELADSLIHTPERTRESIMENGRQAMQIYTQSILLRQATSGKSSWSPQQLRDQPGTTVFLCLSGGELETYHSVMKVILQQTIDILTAKPAPRGSLPITFLLDEFPQLSPNGQAFRPALRGQDLGRGAAVRMLLFSQSLQQLREAYAERTDGILSAAAANIFMQPSPSDAEYIENYLTQSSSLFNNDREASPIIRKHQLLGPDMADKVIAIARGQYPAVLDKVYAWQAFPQLLNWPMPDKTN